jgi:hypothetical protein
MPNQSFEALAHKTFPNLTNTITLKQINAVRDKFNIKSPPYHIQNTRNAVSRGVFKISLDLESNENQESNQDQPHPIAIKYSIHKRFDFIKSTVLMVADGVQNSCIIAGSGGLGKSFTVLKTLKEDGFDDWSHDTDLDLSEFPGEKIFRVIKGYSTARGLYNTLYNNRSSLTIFDDCCAVLKDTVGLNLLKSCLDSNETRIVSWNKSVSLNDSIPTSFEFKGQIIFITNLSIDDLDQALKSRSMTIDVTMTIDEKIERMEYLITQQEFMSNVELEYKLESLDLIKSIKNQIKELSLRTLIQVITVRKSNTDNWRELAIYLSCN